MASGTKGYKIPFAVVTQRGCEIECDDSAVRSLFHNSDISNYLFLTPGDRVERSSLLAA